MKAKTINSVLSHPLRHVLVKDGSLTVTLPGTTLPSLRASEVYLDIRESGVSNDQDLHVDQSDDVAVTR